MGKYDKDRFQKELAIRYCLARHSLPFLEVAVRSSTDLSDSVELLTDIDVLGIEGDGDGSLRRTIFDCKTTNKMSPVNRTFWAAGLKQYTGCDEAYVILKTKAVHNHRISALGMNVDLHDEQSFRDLGATSDTAFPADDCYQASIDRWDAVNDCYAKNTWANVLFDLARNTVPLTKSPSSTFRRILAELRNIRGHVDPAKNDHVVIYLDCLASTFVLWATLGRDIRRFYEPTMSKRDFEKTLRYYLWGGKDSYDIRQQIREIKGKSDSSNNGSGDLPSWDMLFSYVGLLISAPQNILECAYICRELSLKLASKSDSNFDDKLSVRLKKNSRIRQFSVGLSDYLVAAGNLPKDTGKKVEKILFTI